MEKSWNRPWEIQCSVLSGHPVIRITAWVIRFVNKLKKSRCKKKHEEEINKFRKKRQWAEELLSLDELDSAKQLYIKEVQVSMQNVSTFKKLERELNVFMDDQGIMRCGGRLHNAPLPSATKFPILITKNSSIAKLIIWDAHVNVGHNGPTDTFTSDT